MKNPFCPGNGTMPPYLAGRDEEIRWFETSLVSAQTVPQNMVLSGIRGTGKTVLLRRFEEICAGEKWLTVKREFNTKLNHEGLFLTALLTDLIVKTRGVSLAKSIKKPLIGFAEKTRREADDDYVATLLKKYKGTPGDKLEGILADVHGIILKAGYEGLVFLYDEFHFLEDGKAANQFPISLLLEAFSHLQQEGMKYYLVLSGLPPLFSNLVKAKTYAERMFSVRTLGHLPEEEARKAIERPLRESNVVFTVGLINSLVQETRGYPYFLQFYPYFLIQNIPRKRIGLQEFEQMHPLLARELDESFFSGRLSRASDAEQAILMVMAKLGEEIKVSELREKTKLQKNYMNQVLISLIDKGLIYRVGRGKYRFCLPLFEKSLLRAK
ncbi:hypothetical protein ACFLU6_04120 [Acidobacteriota bacterium]